MAPDDIRELFGVFGPVEVRRMFGGAGIYAEGRMFALISDGVIYLKADAHNAAAFEREQLEPFTYATRTGRRGVMSYRRMPDASTTTRTSSRSGRAPRSQRPPAARWKRCARRPAGDEAHARRDACAQTTVTKGGCLPRRVRP